jgi:hypothetical protein
MTIPRRDFMKIFGISLGSLLLARCQRVTPPDVNQEMTCYAPTSVSLTPEFPVPTSLPARERLRLCWLRFSDVAQWTRDAGEKGTEDRYRDELIAEHRHDLDELAAAGAIAAPVGDLIQEAFAAAVYHIWRSNAPITCYDMNIVDYAPESADNLVNQAEILEQIAAGSAIQSETLAKVRAALEHDLAFYTLTDEEVQTLYARLLAEYPGSKEVIPSFAEVELTLTPDVRAAAGYLLDLLVGK